MATPAPKSLKGTAVKPQSSVMGPRAPTANRTATPTKRPDRRMRSSNLAALPVMGGSPSYSMSQTTTTRTGPASTLENTARDKRPGSVHARVSDGIVTRVMAKERGFEGIQGNVRKQLEPDRPYIIFGFSLMGTLEATNPPPGPAFRLVRDIAVPDRDE